jgi:hypothetical protein
MQVPALGRVPLTVVDVDGTTVAIEIRTGYDSDVAADRERHPRFDPVPPCCARNVFCADCNG